MDCTVLFATTLIMGSIAGCTNVVPQEPTVLERKVEEPAIVATLTENVTKGLRIYDVTLQSPDGSVSIQMVSGRPNRQFTDQEHIADIGSPLPKGVYTIGNIVEAPVEKFGGFFIPIEPTFQTARYALGLHHDQEFIVGGEELGTEGCLATMTLEDRQLLLNFFKAYNPTTITVN